jgi:UDP-2,3-diacylglucosamine pyrophosphatase LpxH
MSAAKTVIISDLHVSAGALDDCDAELEAHFSDFLCWLAAGDGPVELVINGDFLDFVQAPPWEGAALSATSRIGNVPLSFTQAQSLEKLDAIYHAHEPHFSALRHFLEARAENRVVILPGNHDADFFLPAVQARFIERVCGDSHAISGRLRFHLEPFYRPDHARHVRIEHGHLYDKCNTFTKYGAQCWSEATPPVATDIAGQERLVECVGTRFLVQYLNGLDRDFPYVDNVKPFYRFITIFGTLAMLPGFAPLKAAAAIWGILAHVARESYRHPRDLLSVPDGGEGGPKAVLQNWVSHLTNDQRTAFLAAVPHHVLPRGQSLDGYLEGPENAEKLLQFLADHPDVLDRFPDDSSLLSGGGAGDLTLAGGFFEDETKVLSVAAQERLQEDPTVQTVVMGHTHEAMNRPSGIAYLNTGCWTRYYRFQASEQIHKWSLLRANAPQEHFPYVLYCAVVPAVPGAPAELKEVLRENA